MVYSTLECVLLKRFVERYFPPFLAGFSSLISLDLNVESLDMSSDLWCHAVGEN